MQAANTDLADDMHYIVVYGNDILDRRERTTCRRLLKLRIVGQQVPSLQRRGTRLAAEHPRGGIPLQGIDTASVVKVGV
jgi:hypothetical protein